MLRKQAVAQTQKRADGTAGVDQQQDRKAKRDRSNRHGEHRIGERQREHSASHQILPGGDDNVANRLWTCVDDGPRARLCAMAEQCATSAEQEGEYLPDRVLCIDDGERQQRAAERPDEAVNSVPGAVEPRHLVGEEFRNQSDKGRSKHPGVRQRGERIEMRGKVDPAAPHGEPGGEDAEIESPAGEQADARGEPQYLDYSHRAFAATHRNHLQICRNGALAKIMSDLAEPIPAATLILMRPGAADAPEILVMERAENMAFAAGALVFPGGRIDPQDLALAKRFTLRDAAGRIAAIRETIEETGIAPALLPAPDEQTVRTIRKALAANEDFEAVLDTHGLRLDLDALTLFARWCPNFRETRRFDTLFYLAAAPADTHPTTADETEAVRTFWSSAEAVLDDVAAGRAHAIFPTRRNLERLARFASLDEAEADAHRHPVEKITPWVEERDGRKLVCIPEGIGYPVTTEPLETARRS